MARSQFEEGLFTHKSLILGWMKDYALSSEVYKHELSGTLHTGQLGDSQAPQFLKTDGSRQLSGNLAVIDGATIDGVDLSEHAGNASAHHSPVTIADSLSIDLTLGGVGGQQLSASVLFGTPVSLSASTANSQGSAGTAAKSDHTHAITASNDVSAAVVETILKSTSAGGLKLKQLDLTNDLTVGNNVLNVDVSTWNVGINCVPDSQFDLDVAGNLRAQGWIVGKHAIQVKDAVMICHFDGQQPYNTDFSGNPTGHMGQVAAVTDGVIYREGKFGKAVQVAEGTTNLVVNPSMENNVTDGYTIGSSDGSATKSRSNYSSVFGNYSMYMNARTSSWCYVRCNNISVANMESVTFSVYLLVRASSGGTVRMSIRDGSTILEYIDITSGYHNTWKRYVITWTNTTGSTVSLHGRLDFPNVAGGIMNSDGWQLEKLSYATPYCDGSLPGHSWSGTAHNSTSTRPNSTVKYDGMLPADLKDKGSLSVYFNPSCNMDGSIDAPGYNDLLRLLFEDNENNGTILIRWSTTNDVVYLAFAQSSNTAYNLSATMDTWYFVTFTWDKDANERKIYVGGELVNSGTFSGFTYTTKTSPELLLNQVMAAGALFDELALFSRALTADEIKAIYESDAPIFAETSTWSWRTPTNLAWADANGLWARDANGYDAFGVVGVDGHSWGGFGLDAGDIVLGRNVSGSSAIKWDISSGKFGFYGNAGANPQVEIGTDGALLAGGGTVKLDTSGITAGSSNNILRIDPSNATYMLWLGHATASSAPFSVKKDGTVYSRGNNMSTAVVTRNSAQSIPNAAPDGGQLIAYNTQVYVSPTSMHSTTTNNHRLTAPIKGIYEVKASGKFGIGVGSSSFRQLGVYRYNSGGTVLGDIAADYRAATVDASTYVGITAMLQLDAGDYVVSRAYHQYGANLNYTPYYFSLTLIKALE